MSISRAAKFLHIKVKWLKRDLSTYRIREDDLEPIKLKKFIERLNDGIRV